MFDNYGQPKGANETQSVDWSLLTTISDHFAPSSKKVSTSSRQSGPNVESPQVMSFYCEQDILLLVPLAKQQFFASPNSSFCGPGGERALHGPCHYGLCHHLHGQTPVQSDQSHGHGHWLRRSKRLTGHWTQEPLSGIPWRTPAGKGEVLNCFSLQMFRQELGSLKMCPFTNLCSTKMRIGAKWQNFRVNPKICTKPVQQPHTQYYFKFSSFVHEFL